MKFTTVARQNEGFKGFASRNAWSVSEKAAHLTSSGRLALHWYVAAFLETSLAEVRLGITVPQKEQKPVLTHHPRSLSHKKEYYTLNTLGEHTPSISRPGAIGFKEGAHKDGLLWLRKLSWAVYL